MFCPKCSSAVVSGQRFCRNCGLKLDLIVDAIEGKARNPFDFEMLKRDLRDLGSSLRAGFEGAGIPVGKTQRLKQSPAPNPTPPVVQLPNWSWEFNKALRKVKAANTRRYSLQQAMLSLFGGGAMLASWFYLLKTVANSGLVESLQEILLHQTGEEIVGIGPILQKLWLLALIPIARGVAHLINGIFIAPKQIEALERENAIAPGPAYYASVSAPSVGTQPVNELENKTPAQAVPGAAPSVTEDETLRFEPR
ncbi:MAG TPA: zinc ribbon domain-containing protein [Blastocatellia bacterium]|nr:zinc ribbon domain-containing protein [Blastocatellia bacterium]